MPKHLRMIFAAGLSVCLIGCGGDSDLNPSFAPEDVVKYKEQADEGGAEAQYLYAKALSNGDGVKTDKRAAAEYAIKSAEQEYELS